MKGLKLPLPALPMKQMLINVLQLVAFKEMHNIL